MSTFSFGIDTTLRINSWNDEAAHYTGKSSVAALGNKYYEVIPPIMVEGKDALAQAILKKEPISLKNHRMACLFTDVIADITITPRKTEDKNSEGIMVTLTAFDSCLAARKLVQSQEQINIGKIASTLVHGVRNPLNALKGAVVYISEKYSREEPLMEFTTIMKDEISRLEEFISKLLSSSLTDTNVSLTDINEVVKRIQVYTSLQMLTQSIRPSFDLGTVPAIMASPFHLEQIILNVINNAIEAMKNGGELRVSTYGEVKADGRHVVIEIADSGPGIMGCKNESPLSRSGGTGRGFGLSITYEFLKRYGGHLEIDRNKDVGTAVRIYIPSEAARSRKEDQPWATRRMS